MPFITTTPTDIQYKPWNTHMVLSCFVICGYVIIFSRSLHAVYPYPSGLLHWHWGNDCQTITKQQYNTNLLHISCDYGIRLVLVGFVVIMSQTGSEIQRPLGQGIWCTVHTKCIVTRNPIITWHFQFHFVNVGILHLKYKYGVQGESRFTCYSHCYVMWCPLMTGIVISQCQSRDGFTPLKHIYNENTNIIEGCYVAFHTNDCWNFP